MHVSKGGSKSFAWDASLSQASRFLKFDHKVLAKTLDLRVALESLHLRICVDPSTFLSDPDSVA